MLKIKEMGYREIDYILENGIELYKCDWNTEIYRCGYDRKNKRIIKSEFKPIRRFEVEGIEKLEEWEKAFEIVGFKEMKKNDSRKINI